MPVAGSAAPVEVRVRVQTRGAERGEAGGAGTLTLVSVPYSEHSSFGELRRCVAALRAERIVPTVNCRSQADLARIVALLLICAAGVGGWGAGARRGAWRGTRWGCNAASRQRANEK